MCIGFQELPGELPYSKLHFFSRFHELQQQGVAQTFAWLTGMKRRESRVMYSMLILTLFLGPGIYHGDLVFGSQEVGDSVIDNVQLLQ